MVKTIILEKKFKRYRNIIFVIFILALKNLFKFVHYKVQDLVYYVV